MDEKYIKSRMKKTCWLSLSFCCSLDKKCEYRDSVMKELNITKEDYKKLKNNFDKQLFEKVKEKHNNKVLKLFGKKPR